MHLLSCIDLTREQMERIFDIADGISEGKETVSVKEGAVLALLFEKQSTRTRVSLEVAMSKLGGRSIYLDASTTHLSRGESLSDTARVLSMYVDFIAARMHRQDRLVEFAETATVPVINALTEQEHPSQALTDLYTIMGRKRRIKGLKIAFAGDVAQNTANSLMIAAAKLGARMSLVGPRSFPPDPEYLTRARQYGIVDVTDNMADGLAHADIVYTDTFVSMGKEREADQRRRVFAPYQINDKTMALANKDALVMHPLPAFRGEEITADVLDGPRSIVWEQARNKLVIEQAVIIYLSEQSM